MTYRILDDVARGHGPVPIVWDTIIVFMSPFLLDVQQLVIGMKIYGM